MPVNYNGDPEDVLKGEKLYIDDGNGPAIKAPILFKTQKPSDANGQLRDQTEDAARNMRYAKSLNLPELRRRQLPRYGRAIIVGGAPSIKDHLDEIRRLSSDPLNAVFAVNWSHTWLIQNGIVPKGCVFFEIDAEPDTVLKNAHKDVTYYICCHCHQKTFDMLEGYNRVLWHTIPNSKIEVTTAEELFPNADLVGGGIGTFTRTMTVALYLGYRHLDLFGCDSSFPDNSTSHVEGYETAMDSQKDGFYVYAKDDSTGDVRRFRTLGYLALQHEEFKEYCLVNHNVFSCRVYGDGLLQWSHKRMFPSQYDY
jgi:uncharacterized Rossmann fold enzyme